jgi:hypothetical protein
MYATATGNYEFSLVTNEVFRTDDIIGYGGNSGGPLCVEYTNDTYYPAGVYLGGTENTIVRAIDSDVAVLINDANVSAATGANHGGNGGVPGAPENGLNLTVGTYQIIISPAAAISAGAGWKVVGQTASYQTTNGTVSIPTGTYTVTFHGAAGYTTPGNIGFTISGGQTTIVPVIYTASAVTPGPPIVALTNPAPNAIFTIPANVLLGASASDTNSGGSVTELTFLAGTNSLAVLTGAPFAYAWTNPPIGSNILTAVAVNNFGLSATSAAVNILIIPPRPSLLAPAFTNHTLRLSISGLAGESIAIDRSTNLIIWQGVVTNVVPSGGSTNFTDVTLTNSSRVFYRARVVP